MSKRVSKITQLLAVAAALEQAKPQQSKHTEMSQQAQFYLITLLAFFGHGKGQSGIPPCGRRCRTIYPPKD